MVLAPKLVVSLTVTEFSTLQLLLTSKSTLFNALFMSVGQTDLISLYQLFCALSLSFFKLLTVIAFQSDIGYTSPPQKLSSIAFSQPANEG